MIVLVLCILKVPEDCWQGAYCIAGQNKIQKDGVIMNRKNIGQNLRILRQQKGMTQAQLAEETGVSTDHISHAEIGFGTISLPLLIEICKLLKVTPNDILAGEYVSDIGKDEDAVYEEGLYGKELSYEKINPDDRMLLNYMYQFMVKRKRDD